MRRRSSIALVAVLALAGCGGGGGDASGKPTGTATASTAATTAATTAADAKAACSRGVTAGQPGVVSVTCDGPAHIKIQVGDVTKDLIGGECKSADGAWSAAVGVVIDKTGAHGAYAGPRVDAVTVNDTPAHGKGTAQATIDGKNYYVLARADLTLSADRKTAHLEGFSDPTSDAPNVKLVVDVACG